ncbi:hypothetical protein [Propionibacterium freudenreichii]|uniref:hypothetical protein n=1 Tax=Propionibacterium freudenreichii TaxID=1744 RepID=UPI000B140F9D|nr:hypothetical protein [Propionibacterium freudenreichii]
MTDKNKGQETSKTAILTVAEAAELITAQPKSVTVQEGSPASFTVTAAGDNLTYSGRPRATTARGRMLPVPRRPPCL